MTDFDINVDNYTVQELLTIANIANIENESDIIQNTNALINKFKFKNQELSIFFQNVQQRLLEEKEDIVEGFDNNNIDQADEWYQNESLLQSDPIQADKITQRKQKIDIFDSQHVPMNREQLATTDTFNLPVKQDSLNPNLKNTINRFVNLDSQFRQYTSGIDSASTNYTLDLSDMLKNALSLRLYSYQIPFSWYAIDIAYGNTCFWIVDASYTVAISVPSGNYSQSGFVTQLITSFTESGITFTSPQVPVKYNLNNGLITLNLNGGVYTEGGVVKFTITSETIIVFYDFTGKLQCNISCASNLNHYFNNTLGWLMGYKVPYVNVDPSGNTASAILDLTGTKYLILVIDDYNQNHVNNSLVSIAQKSNILKIPSYYSTDLPQTCFRQGENLSQLMSANGSGLLIAGKYENDYTDTQIVLPSAPRTLTNAQLYTINEINKTGNNMTNYLAKAPTSSDILAILPMKTSTGVPTGSLLVEFSGSLQDSSRMYFGPVNIERMAVKLLDDKGNVLNLNGNDWCCTLVCECLYQY